MKKCFLVLFLSFLTMQVSAQFTPSLRLSYEAGADSEKNNSFGLDLIGDYKISPIFSVGVGTGIYYSNFLFHPSTGKGLLSVKEYYEAGAYVPLFADVKINFTSKGVSPYLRVNPGCSFIVPFSDYAREYMKLGAMLSIMAGLDIPIDDGHAMFVEAGYKSQKMSSTSVLYVGDLSFNQIRFSIGYSF